MARPTSGVTVSTAYGGHAAGPDDHAHTPPPLAASPPDRDGPPFPSPEIVTAKSPGGRGVPEGFLRRADAAKFLGIGQSTLDRYNAAGVVPRPTKLCDSVGWGRQELETWIARGCPDRQTWQPIWDAMVAGRRPGRAN